MAFKRRRSSTTQVRTCSRTEPSSVIPSVLKNGAGSWIAVARLTAVSVGSRSKRKKPAAPYGVRGLVLTCEKSPHPYPKLVDPGLARVKRRESSVEAHTGAVLQALG